jgi:hypothetical protein
MVKLSPALSPLLKVYRLQEGQISHYIFRCGLDDQNPDDDMKDCLDFWLKKSEKCEDAARSNTGGCPWRKSEILSCNSRSARSNEAFSQTKPSTLFLVRCRWVALYFALAHFCLILRASRRVHLLHDARAPQFPHTMCVRFFSPSRGGSRVRGANTIET